MKNIVCCFGDEVIFSDEDGDKEIINLKKQLTKRLKTEITRNDAEIFMTGRQGEFNNLFASVVRELKGKFPYIKLVLVESHFSESLYLYKEHYEKMYDCIVICSESASAKSDEEALLRNMWMAENSDLVITYVKGFTGNEFMAMKYAQCLYKSVINMCGAD